MIIRIGCADGQTYESDHTDDAEMQAEIDKANGYVFTGDLAHKRISTLMEFVEAMSEFLVYDSRNNTQKFSMQIRGVQRTFNAQHIVWFEFEFDKE